MPDGFVLLDPDGNVVDPENPPHGYTREYRIDWHHGAELTVKGAGDVMRRITRKLPEPKKWIGEGAAPKESDVLRLLKAKNYADADASFLYLGYGDDPGRDKLVMRAVVANVKGEDDGGVGAMLERILGA